MLFEYHVENVSYRIARGLYHRSGIHLLTILNGYVAIQNRAVQLSPCPEGSYLVIKIIPCLRVFYISVRFDDAIDRADAHTLW